MTNLEINQLLHERVTGLPLVKGGTALIDEEDYIRVRELSWTTNDRGYVVSWWRKEGKKGCIYLHALIMETPKGKHTDHKNHNKLDNRKVNLRICTQAENTRNRQILPGFRSKFKGVTKDKNRNGWRASIYHLGKNIYLGTFDNEIDAAKVYDKKAKELFKEFACINFIQECV